VTEQEARKREAAKRALTYVESGMVVGLGTGSTVAHFLDLLGVALRQGALTDLVGVPSSNRTVRESGAHGIPLGTLAQYPRLDLTVDGADEVSPRLDLIKGMGGALLREKMLVQASKRFVVIADESKTVDRLGTVSPLPVEVVDWGWEGHATYLEEQGATVSLRKESDGVPFRSDNGHLMLHCRFAGGIADPGELHAGIKARAGVVETGLFLGMASQAIVAGVDGVRVLERPR